MLIRPDKGPNKGIKFLQDIIIVWEKLCLNVVEKSAQKASQCGYWLEY